MTVKEKNYRSGKGRAHWWMTSLHSSDRVTLRTQGKTVRIYQALRSINLFSARSIAQSSARILRLGLCLRSKRAKEMLEGSKPPLS